MENYVPRVSVIIPCYNTARYVKETIESVLNQTRQDFEIIVVDDGSTDDSHNVIASINDQRIRYHYQPNQGLAAARNTGLALATGEFVAFLDADDFFLPEKLARQIAALDSQPEVGLVAGGHLYVDEFGNSLAESQPWIYNPQLDLRTWVCGCPVVPGAPLVRSGVSSGVTES